MVEDPIDREMVKAIHSVGYVLNVRKFWHPAANKVTVGVVIRCLFHGVVHHQRVKVGGSGNDLVNNMMDSWLVIQKLVGEEPGNSVGG